MDQLSNGDDEDLDKPTDGDVLVLPKGPMTRSRSRKLTQVIGGLVKRSWKQEECLATRETTSEALPEQNSAATASSRRRPASVATREALAAATEPLAASSLIRFRASN
uniref:Uncharacterized protein n=1 Tax=Brassica campestris TaxID=3711 RepID=M4FER5_BRACM